MTRLSRRMFLAPVTALVLTAPLVVASRSEAKPLDCAKGTIGAAIAGTGPITVIVKGTCNENVVIERDDVTLQADVGGATVHATDPTKAAILIQGARRVRIIGFGVNGGTGGVVGRRGASFDLSGPGCLIDANDRFGVVASYGASGTVDNCTIQGTTGEGNGVVAANESSLVITNSTVQNNAAAGVVAVRNSQIRIGQNANGDAVILPVTITGNAGNGVTIGDSSAGIVVGGSISNNSRTGIFVGRGSSGQIGAGQSGLVGGPSVQNNGGTGITIEGANATVLSSTISLNGGNGVQLINGGSARIGIKNDNSGYLGNVIANNGGSGVALSNSSSTALGGNLIQANGTNPAVFAYGVLALRGSAVDFVGDNTVADNASAGLLVTEGAFARIGDVTFGLSTINTFSGNGTATSGPSSTTPGGMWAFDGSMIQTRGTVLLTGNKGLGVTAIMNSTIELREGTTVTGTVAHPPSNNPGFGIFANVRSVIRVRDNTAITSNAFDGIQLNTGSVIDFFLGATVSVTGNAGFGLRCNGGQTFYSGNVTGVTGNTTGGNVDVNGNIPGCTRF